MAVMNEGERGKRDRKNKKTEEREVGRTEGGEKKLK